LVKRKIIFNLLLAAIITASSCGVKFETGQTKEEAQASSQITANKIKSDWARLINNSSPQEVGFHLKTHLENISIKLIEYGFRLAEKWQEGNEGRGSAIPDNEMRTVIENWISGDEPIINAWEDNIDYARQRLVEDGFYTQETTASFDKMIEHFNTVYNTVLFPEGDVFKYEDQLMVMKSETEKQIRKVEIEIDRY